MFLDSGLPRRRGPELPGAPKGRLHNALLNLANVSRIIQCDAQVSKLPTTSLYSTMSRTSYDRFVLSELAGLESLTLYL